MIIVNKYADYSANSIGHVDIPFEDETATALMAKYSKTISSANRTAFAHLIADLKNAGLDSSIQCMIIPFLAANGVEATMDSWRDVNSNYNPSIQLGLHVGKYGTYYVQSEVDSTARSCYVNTEIHAPATLASLSYVKTAENGPLANAGLLWNSQAYITGGGGNINVSPDITLAVGENIVISSISSSKTSTATPKITHNGNSATKSYSASQIESDTSLNVGKLAVSCLADNFYISTFYYRKAQTAIAILFDKELTETERQAVNTALHNFSMAIYENDITTIMQ